MTSPRSWLVVPAAGIGQRMRADCPKQYLTISDRFVLDITLSRLMSIMAWQGCVVALSSTDRWWPASESAADGRIDTCVGGSDRADSVLASLQYLSGRAAEQDWVLVHDVARPCIHRDDVLRLVSQLADHPVGGLLAAPVADTIKEVTPGTQQVAGTMDRGRLWRALTPQMFRYGPLMAALHRGVRDDPESITDESSAMERDGQMPEVIAGRADNIKITVPEDLALAEFILSRQASGD
ncbi:2-C-methyl-D-erythritol 4-phosphate cytidylyltransferase [Marinobacter daqiaonensis]|uniref:2-C-methyl-D-erythritol 4-phosphate cytidylyltransferase n=1 Tax=Marinobacter daqiaonensis TaxID=650891 RepID=A0A1I6GFG3_9GAMM|nr:2-C-methyl-D-erythritol 4-phosphate cytidylyltransferase [Marinobacter daqiaonensis]SFR40926.1 2-C-methyl-D-erythritol 4-phosphate cytidylyltransferase [Marinobacter daqiaonensis]